jgi:tRNA nucleotidyltransferase (CCA-adding enzyme)
MAWNPISGEIVDPFGGQKDLKAGIIRAVGDARKRFQEDGLRIARAIRFAAKFGFEIEAKTLAAIKEEEAQKKFDCVSKERQRDEFVKTITSAGAIHGITLMIETGIMKRVIPEVHFEQFKKLMEVAPSCSKEERIAVLVGEQPQVLKSLKFTRAEVEAMTKMAKNKEVFKGAAKDADIRKAISVVGKEMAKRMINVSKANGVDVDEERVNSIIASNPPVTVKELVITGKEVASILGIKPGPRVGEVLNKVLEEVIKNPELNNRTSMEKIVQAMK